MSVIILKDRFIFKENYKIISVAVFDIVFFESMGHYIAVHMKDGSTHTARCGMCELVGKVHNSLFARVHRGITVNLSYVIRVKSTEIVLNSLWERVPVSRKYKKNVKRAFDEFNKRT